MKAFLLVLQTLLLVSWLAQASAQVSETYPFRDSFDPLEGAGNVLVPVSNATGTIVTSGADFRNGAFVTESISSSACAAAPTVRAWSFPEMAGLRHDNGAPTSADFLGTASTIASDVRTLHTQVQCPPA